MCSGFCFEGPSCQKNLRALIDLSMQSMLQESAKDIVESINDAPSAAKLPNCSEITFSKDSENRWPDDPAAATVLVTRGSSFF